MKKNIILKILIIVCTVVCFFSGYKLLCILQEYNEIETLYEETADEYTEVLEEEEQTTPIKVDFSELLSINEDIIGWIYIDGTVVNYPMLQGMNNKYYLDKTYYKKYLASGSIYLDTDNKRDLSDAHSIIYGHNMKNHTMFGDMDDFMDEKYLADHPYIDILLSDGTRLRYQIFSVYRAHVEDGTYGVPLNKEENFEKFLQVALEKNMYKGSTLTLPVPKTGDKILTLSTCTEDSAVLERFVVHAVLIEK